MLVNMRLPQMRDYISDMGGMPIMQPHTSTATVGMTNAVLPLACLVFGLEEDFGVAIEHVRSELLAKTLSFAVNPERATIPLASQGDGAGSTA
jgi:hypothetical protein